MNKNQQDQTEYDRALSVVQAVNLIVFLIVLFAIFVK